MGRALEIGEPDRLLRIKEVMQRVPLGRSTIYARMSRGDFPPARVLGGGVVAWLESEVSAWISACPTRESGNDNQG
jgi:prophage regulatory protein